MYVNFSEFDKAGLSGDEFLLLLAVKQKEFNYICEAKTPVLEYLLKNNLIKQIKGGGKSERWRIDKKGNKLLNALEKPEIEEQDEKIFEWLEGVYKSRDKMIGNKKRTKEHIRAFRESTGIEKNNLAYLCKRFLEDENNMKYNNKLEFAFYKPLNPYSTSFKLEDSRLYIYYLEHEDFFKTKFNKL